MQWDLFCRVVDNFGDIGVCWRLAADLAARGETVRLWVDDPSALAWMAPHGTDGVTVQRWAEPLPEARPGDVVIEAFGCELPSAFVQRMAAAAQPPCWINLEYLSAQAYVERSHRLPSPQLSGPGQGLTKWFFYPGFSAATGGLIREEGLLSSRQQFRCADWLRAHDIAADAGERLVSLFGYDPRALPAVLSALPAGPIRVLATAGTSAELPALPGHVKVQRLPALSQTDYDRLLWSCDLNLVRGEDSFVRAQWAARPFLWQVYPQSDGAHAAKLEAFLDLFLNGVEAGEARALRGLWRAWNGLAPMALAGPDWAHWTAHAATWCTQLAAQADLTTQLLGFARKTR